MPVQLLELRTAALPVRTVAQCSDNVLISHHKKNDPLFAGVSLFRYIKKNAKIFAAAEIITT